MARIYLRLKHFVAAYVRKVYGAGSDDLSCELVINPYSKAASHLERMQCNTADKIVPNCFCERQWQRMMRGDSIMRDADNFMVTPRDTSEWLSETEVCELAGIDPMRGEDMGEFVCIHAPSEVIRQNGNKVPTNGQWQLMHDATIDLIEEIERDFDRALFDFIDGSIASASENGQRRYTRDALENFMTAYDIRNCEDDREKNCLKRRYYRYLREKMKVPINDNYHTGKELHKRTEYTANNGHKILCEDDGQVYDSIYAASRAYGVRYKSLWTSLRRGYRCGGRRFAELS